MAKSKKGFISASLLKLIAVASMITDHACVILGAGEPFWLRYLGRLAFPIFAFLITEGVRHTKSKFRYAVRLLIFAFISEIPYDYALIGNPFDFSKQNVYFTLFLGLMSVIILDKLQARNLGFLGIFSTILFSTGALYLKSDFGFIGVVVITLMFVFSGTKSSARYMGIALSCAVTCFAVVLPLNIVMVPAQIYATASVIPISLYNGKRGFRMNKYVFYLIYPLHLLILALIKLIII